MRFAADVVVTIINDIQSNNKDESTMKTFQSMAFALLLLRWSSEVHSFATPRRLLSHYGGGAKLLDTNNNYCAHVNTFKTIHSSSSIGPLYVGANFDENDNKSNEDESQSLVAMISGGLPKIAAVALVGFVFINMLSFGFSITTAAIAALFQEIGHELIHLLSILGNILLWFVGAIFNLAKSATPILGNGVVAAGKAAAPVVQDLSGRIGDAAAPVIQDVSQQIGNVAAPYVQSAAETANTNLISPLRDATSSVTDSVNSVVDSGIQEVTTAVDSSIVAPMNAVKETVSTAVDSTIKDATSSITSAIDTNIVGPVDAVKDNAFGAVDNVMKGTADTFTGTLRSVFSGADAPL